jgi:hypothetical protein
MREGEDITMAAATDPDSTRSTELGSCAAGTI